MARVSLRGSGRGSSSEDLDYTRCIMVNEDGKAMYMVITDDGRWVPAEEEF